MLTLQDIKNKIVNKDKEFPLIIFQIKDCDFIPLQYIEYIKNDCALSIEYLDNENQLVSNNSLFGEVDNNNFKVLFTNELKEVDNSILDLTNTMIIIKDNNLDWLDKYIITIPKLEEWQIKDYVYSMCEGVDRKELDSLIEICKNDIFRINKEIEKITIFDIKQRENIFKMFIHDNIFSDLSNHNIFDMSNAIIRKYYNSVTNLYLEIENIDCEPLGLLTILIKNFRNILSIQTSPNATAESLGITDKQLWAIRKYNCGYYTKDQLFNIYSILTDIDRRIKTGEFPMEILVDYLITKVLINI